MVATKRTKENKVAVREKVKEERKGKIMNGYIESFEACEEKQIVVQGSKWNGKTKSKHQHTLYANNERDVMMQNYMTTKNKKWVSWNVGSMGGYWNIIMDDDVITSLYGLQEMDDDHFHLKCNDNGCQSIKKLWFKS
jgi:hypothetical protein